MNKLSNFTRNLEALQEVLIANNDKDFIHGDGKILVDNKDFPIKHNFSDSKLGLQGRENMYHKIRVIT